MKKYFKNGLAVSLVVALVLALCACGKKPAPQENMSSSAEMPVQAELYGAPWVTSIADGNLPDNAPEAKDDLFLHYNFDELQAVQGTFYSKLVAGANVIGDDVASEIENGTLSAADGLLTEAELAQLNIFYQQAADLDAIQQAGISQLQPYLDRIAGAGTLEELNQVLASEDFPFSPFLFLCVSAYDMSGVNNVFIYPEFLFVDNVDGAYLYQEEEDEFVATANMQMISQTMLPVLFEMSCLGMTQEDTQAWVQQLYMFEQSYGQAAGATNIYLKKDYGAYGAATENLSLDEVAALCPNYPVKETIRKFGKDGSPFFSVLEKKWLQAFNSVWTEENLEILKMMTQVKVLHECAPYLDPQVTDQLRLLQGLQPMDAKGNAANACNQNKTFGQLFGKVYVAEHYTDEDFARMKNLTAELIESFRGLVKETTWLSEGSREKVLLKLDKITQNILIPDGGFIDYSGLSLTPTEEGGTLLGNYLKLKAYVDGKINDRIGQPAQARNAWESFIPATVNCFYDPDNNSINIFPGFTAAGMYRDDMTYEELLAGLGWVIGHEISHGFDFSGSQYDANGTGNSIFGEEDLQDYLTIVDQLVAYYDTLEPFPGIRVKGNLVKVEAAADLIGMQLVLKTAEGKEDLDYEAVFRQCAEIYSTVMPVQNVQILLGADSHPLNYLRTNVNVQMFDELYDTYEIKEGDGMYLPKESRICFWGK